MWYVLQQTVKTQTGLTNIKKIQIKVTHLGNDVPLQQSYLECDLVSCKGRRWKDCIFIEFKVVSNSNFYLKPPGFDYKIFQKLDQFLSLKMLKRGEMFTTFLIVDFTGPPYLLACFDVKLFLVNCQIFHIPILFVTSGFISTFIPLR